MRLSLQCGSRTGPEYFKDSSCNCNGCCASSFMLQAVLASYYLCLFIETQFQLGSCIHASTNEAHSLANLKDLIPNLAGLCFLYLSLPKYRD